jgi:hypothetical protein
MANLRLNLETDRRIRGIIPMTRQLRKNAGVVPINALSATDSWTLTGQIALIATNSRLFAQRQFLGQLGKRIAHFEPSGRLLPDTEEHISVLVWLAICTRKTVALSSEIEFAEKRKGRAMWDKDDWEQYFHIIERRWQRHLPPRPVAPISANRTLPVVGFSLSELDAAGINVQVAERLGLPVDGARIGAYSANVSTLRDFVRLARHPK